MSLLSQDWFNGRRQAAQRALQAPRFEAGLQALAEELKRPLAEIKAEAEQGLRAMVSIQSPIYGYLFDNVLGPLHRNAWSIDVNAQEIQNIVEMNAQKSLVFLPTHRSYADAFILTQVLQNGGLPRNHILGGNNVDFFPLGTIIKRSGGVLIRRSFRDDEVYKFIVREYLGQLVASGANLEWYMEGGRSRTGKLRPPKYGLLHYLVQALQSDGVDDMLLVPVSITYDQLHEIMAMAEEESGSKRKPPEGLTWLAQYGRMQQRWIGNAYVRFGEPLSLRGALLETDSETGSPWAVEKVAFEVFQRINRVTPVTAPALVTLALLAARGRALTLAETTQLIEPLLDYADQRGLPTEAIDALRGEEGVYEVLLSLADAQLLERYEDGTERVFRIQAGKHGVAAFYRNSAIHWFVNRAILEVSMLSPVDPDGEDVQHQAWDAAFALRDLLKFEFFFSDKESFREEIKAESRILSNDFRRRTATEAGRRELLLEAPFRVAHRVLTQFLEAYYIVADRLAAWPQSTPVDRKALLEQCTQVGRQYVLQQRLRNPESVSRELFGNALSLANNRGLLDDGNDCAQKRQQFADDMQQAVAAVAHIEGLDTQARDSVEEIANERA